MGCASSLPIVASGAVRPAPAPQPTFKWPGLCPAEKLHAVPPFHNIGGDYGGP